MLNLSRKPLSLSKVLLITSFITLFFLLGAPLHLYTFLSVIPNEIYGITIWGNVWKVTWALLAFAFMIYYRKEMPISIAEMLNPKKIDFKVILITLSIITLFDIAYSLFIHKNVLIQDNFNFFKSFTTYFFVGLTEEIVFRGWALNAFLKVTSITKANIIQSVFFMLAHLLPWCLYVFGRGNFSDVPLTYLAIQMPYCILIGCILGIIFYKKHSLWTVSIIHCFNDVIAVMLLNM